MSIFFNYTVLQPFFFIFNYFSRGEYDRTKQSLVHIYFATEYQTLYKTDLYYYWYDIISKFQISVLTFLKK